MQGWLVGFSLSELKCKDEMGVRKSCKVGSTLLRARPSGLGGFSLSELKCKDEMVWVVFHSLN